IVYRASRAILPTRAKWAVPLFAVSVFVVLRFFLARQHAWAADWSKDEPFYFYTGADQLVVYGERYATLALLLTLFGLACTIAGLISRQKEERASSLWLSFELYTVAFVAIALLPENLRPFPQGGWIGLLVSRLTILPAVFGLGVLASLRPRIWHFGGFAV